MHLKKEMGIIPGAEEMEGELPAKKIRLLMQLLMGEPAMDPEIDASAVEDEPTQEHQNYQNA